MSGAVKVCTFMESEWGRHYSGVYTIKASSGRFLKSGNTNTSVPGQQGVAVSFSPLARTLDDLETFWKAVMSMKPWDYDHFVLPIPWREVDLSSAKGLRWGVLWDDGESHITRILRR